jgi:hypothetical protein
MTRCCHNLDVISLKVAFARQGICSGMGMSLWSYAPSFPDQRLPPPHLLLMLARRDNLMAYEKRLLRQIDELTEQIERELRTIGPAVDEPPRQPAA